MADDGRVGLRCLVSGRVQGVGFRWFVTEKAEVLGLTGYARNLPDGRVEVVANGPRQALDRLVEAMRQGPSASHVTGVDVEWGEIRRDVGEAFRVR